ncbi:uncharacterized protein LOC21397431 isoform X2 [Morus notabilis]|uniref:uncharacterized protein LOC21397431 isoform X2 n=1 Tax=Morus notabilis TaxID=981085 RepID=UPI000CECFB8D|nr:uncharacterized protein LOC21397431 isoform X2 [Morus notabilis]
MDLWSVQVKYTGRSPLFLRNSFPEKPISLNPGKKWNSLLGIGEGRVFEIRVLKRRVTSSGLPSFVVRAMGKKNHGNSSFSGNGDQSTPEGDGGRGSNSSDSQNSLRISTDWREVRANLFAREQAEKAESDTQNKEKLDGVRTFERTVVLLLRSGTRHPQEGPFGVVINRPLHKKIKHMKPTNIDLATTFSDCFLHFGGPLEASMFLLKTGGRSKLPGFEEVIPGLCFGARNSLDEAAELVKKGALKPQDFRFFVGYAGWQLDQLREEIESDYWYVAACSSNLINGGFSDSSSENLWEEILQLMGGHYSELSRKPKQDM